MIIGFFGNVRQGKTLGAVRELEKLYKRGYTIYSNTWLNFPHKGLTLDFLYEIVENDPELEDKIVFFIDEIHIWLDSRLASSKRNRIASYFLLQTGKMGKDTDYGLILLFTSQYPDQIDKRLRHVLDIAIQCEKVIYREEKYFRLSSTFFRGSKTFTKIEMFKGTTELYGLYDTRKKIKVELTDRYDENT